MRNPSGKLADSSQTFALPYPHLQFTFTSHLAPQRRREPIQTVKHAMKLCQSNVRRVWLFVEIGLHRGEAVQHSVRPCTDLPENEESEEHGDAGGETKAKGAP
ncbi:hypothetical protein GCM10022270_24030 [Terriglobus aquaticus]